jgi:hypothetical protein
MGLTILTLAHRRLGTQLLHKVCNPGLPRRMVGVKLTFTVDSGAISCGTEGLQTQTIVELKNKT